MKKKSTKPIYKMATYIGETQGKYVNGNQYNVAVVDMTGKIYESLNDMEGKKDERIMVYSASSSCAESWLYKVYETAADLLKEWSIYPLGGSPRVQAEILRQANP